MTITYGATELPVPEPDTGETVSDPALDAFASFFKAIIEEECTDAWATVAAGEDVVRSTATHDPGEADFSANRLPGLFVFRVTADPQQFTDEEWGAETTLAVLWIFPPGEQFRHAQRLGIFSGLQKALHGALGPRNGRHPAWIVDGDTDTDAATFGSSILTHAGVRWAKLGAIRYSQIRVGEESFEGIYADLRIREDWSDDIADVEPPDVAVTITGNGAFSQTTEQPIPEGD